LPMFISRSLLSQKRPKQFIKCYNSIGDGAIRTIIIIIIIKLKSTDQKAMVTYCEATKTHKEA
jgi:hypothetical protein